MFKPNIFLPLNISRTKQDNALITSSFKNQAISLLDWLGIDLINGSSSLVLAKNGTWVSQLNIYSVTETQFNTAVTNSILKFPAIYKITDIQNGLYIQTLSSSTFSPDAKLSFLAPDYTLHDQYHTTDGAIANNAIVTWGGYYWQNTSGGGATPNVPDEVDLDDTGAFTKITKSAANGYEQVLLSVMVDTSLDILETIDNYNNRVNNAILSNFGLTYENTMINNIGIQFNNGWAITNCKTSSPLSIILNKSIATPIIKRCLDNIANNKGVGTLDVTYIENCNGVLGNHFHLSYAKNIEINGNSTMDESDYNNLSKIENISVTGDDNFIASGYLDSSSSETNITITGDRNEINSRELSYNSSISNFTITCDDFICSNLNLSNAALLSNYTTTTNGRKLEAFNVSGHQIDFTGWDRDIVGESIIEGNGSFVITHNFGTSNLASGASVLYNLIPTGARLTNCTIVPSSITGGAGATLRVGLETDDVSYGLAATLVGAIPNTVINTVSNAATANRSLQLTAGVANITGGSVTIKVEFIL